MFKQQRCWPPRLRHPCRQQSQGPIGLADDQVPGAGVALRADHLDRLTAARVKRVEDPNLGRQTPGSMALLRPAPARRRYPQRCRVRCRGEEPQGDICLNEVIADRARQPVGRLPGYNVEASQVEQGVKTLRDPPIVSST